LPALAGRGAARRGLLWCFETPIETGEILMAYEIELFLANEETDIFETDDGRFLPTDAEIDRWVEIEEDFN
jgi:hypothetical protein